MVPHEWGFDPRPCRVTQHSAGPPCDLVPHQARQAAAARELRQGNTVSIAPAAVWCPTNALARAVKSSPLRWNCPAGTRPSIRSCTRPRSSTGGRTWPSAPTRSKRVARSCQGAAVGHGSGMRTTPAEGVGPGSWFALGRRGRTSPTDFSVQLIASRGALVRYWTPVPARCCSPNHRSSLAADSRSSVGALPARRGTDHR